MIAQRVSAGFRLPMKTSPGGATERLPLRPPTFGPFPDPNHAPEHLQPSRAPLLPETHSHAETLSPPRLDYPSSQPSRMRAEELLKREPKAQESGNKVAAIHRLLPAVVPLTAQFIRTIRNGIALRMRWLAALAPLRISMTACL